MKELILKFMGEQEAENRKTLSVDSVPLDESGLRELLVRSNYFLMVSLAESLLKSPQKVCMHLASALPSLNLKIKIQVLESQ